MGLMYIRHGLGPFPASERKVKLEKKEFRRRKPNHVPRSICATRQSLAQAEGGDAIVGPGLGVSSPETYSRRCTEMLQLARTILSVMKGS